MDRKFVTKFVAYWIVNSIILGLANAFFPTSFVLGNAFMVIPTAAIFSGFLLTTLLFLAKGLAKGGNLAKKGRLFMFLFYWGSAAFGIWLVARIAPISGFGIARFTWAIAAGFVVSLTNWLLRQAFKGMKLL